MFEQNNWQNIFDKLFHVFVLSDQEEAIYYDLK